MLDVFIKIFVRILSGVMLDITVGRQSPVGPVCPATVIRSAASTTAVTVRVSAFVRKASGVKTAPSVLQDTSPQQPDAYVSFLLV